tara:strand:+ start:563 stop:817 length:255 start_codon:yes stop_codon:yes gene_type:complete
MNKTTNVITKLKQEVWKEKLAIRRLKESMVKYKVAAITNPKALEKQTYIKYENEIESTKLIINGLELAIDFISTPSNNVKKENK